MICETESALEKSLKKIIFHENYEIGSVTVAIQKLINAC